MAENVTTPDSIEDLKVDVTRLFDGLNSEVRALVREDDEAALRRMIQLFDHIVGRASASSAAISLRLYQKGSAK